MNIIIDKCFGYATMLCNQAICNSFFILRIVYVKAVAQGGIMENEEFRLEDDNVGINRVSLKRKLCWVLFFILAAISLYITYVDFCTLYCK